MENRYVYYPASISPDFYCICTVSLLYDRETVRGSVGGFFVLICISFRECSLYNRSHTWHIYLERCVTDGYMVSESVAILCICGTTGYPAVVFFVIPIQIKWLAILDGLYFVYAIVQAFLQTTAEVTMAYYTANAHCVHLDPELFLKFTEY